MNNVIEHVQLSGSSLELLVWHDHDAGDQS